MRLCLFLPYNNFACYSSQRTKKFDGPSIVQCGLVTGHNQQGSAFLCNLASTFSGNRSIINKYWLPYIHESFDLVWDVGLPNRNDYCMEFFIGFCAFVERANEVLLTFVHGNCLLKFANLILLVGDVLSFVLTADLEDSWVLEVLGGGKTTCHHRC